MLVLPAGPPGRRELPGDHSRRVRARGLRVLREVRLKRAFAMPRMAARIFGVPLAIEPGKLEVILAAIGDRVTGVDLSGLDSRGALLPQRGDKPDAESITHVVDSVAMIDVSGTLVHRSSWMDAISGLLSYEKLSEEFDRAIADPNIKGVLLCIDSPGGEVSGCFEMAERIHAARGRKPVYAIASDTACSAAYLLGSACEKFYATEAALTGSIGVVVAHLDVSEADKRAGVRITHIHAGARKVDGNPHEPLSEDARDALENLVQKTYSVFVSRVAAYRGIPEADVRATEAAVYVGGDAKKVRIIDGIRSTRAALADLKSGQRSMEFSQSLMAMSVPYVASDSTSSLVAGGGGGWIRVQINRSIAEEEDGSHEDPPESEEAPGSAVAPDSQPPQSGEDSIMNEKELKAALEAAQKEIASLKADLAEARTRVAVAVEAQRNAIIEKHIRAGRITPATRDDVQEFGKAMEPDDLDARLSKWPVVTRPIPSGVTSVDTAVTDPDPLKVLEAKAAAIRSANPSMTAASAFVAACEQNPTLYAEHRKQHRAANTRR